MRAGNGQFNASFTQVFFLHTDIFLTFLKGINKGLSHTRAGNGQIISIGYVKNNRSKAIVARFTGAGIVILLF